MTLISFPDPRMQRPMFLQEFGTPSGLDRRLDFQTRLGFQAMPTALGAFSDVQMRNRYAPSALQQNSAMKGAIDRAASTAEYLAKLRPGDSNLQSLSSGLTAVSQTINPNGPLGLDQKFNGKWQIQEFYDVINDLIVPSPALNDNDVYNELVQSLKDGSGGQIQDFDGLVEEAWNLLTVWTETRDRILKDAKQQAETNAALAESVQMAEKLKREAAAAEAERQSLPKPPPPRTMGGGSGLMWGLVIAGGLGVALLLYKISK